MTPTFSAPQQLAALLVELLGSSAHIRAFLRALPATEILDSKLPSERVSAEEMSDAVVTTLNAHGLFIREVFEALAHLRPRRRAQIEDVARLFGISLPPPGTEAIVSVHRLHLSPRLLVSASVLLSIAIAGVVAVFVLAHDAPVTDPGLEQEILVDRAAMPRSPQDCWLVKPDNPSIVSLTNSELSPFYAKIVSRKLGKEWDVAIPGHMEASVAAKELFFTLFVEPADRKVASIMMEDTIFELCQGDVCFIDDVVSDALDCNSAIWISKVVIRIDKTPSGRTQRIITVKKNVDDPLEGL